MSMSKNHSICYILTINIFSSYLYIKLINLIQKKKKKCKTSVIYLLQFFFQFLIFINSFLNFIETFIETI